MRRYRLHYHSQNLNGWPKGSIFWHGRAWLSVWGHDRQVTPEIGWEWLFGRRATFCHLHLEFNQGDYDIVFSVALPFLFAFWVHLENVPGWRGPGYWADSYRRRPGKKFWMPAHRQIGLTWYEGTLWIDLWHDLAGSSRSDPWWWEVTIRPWDILLGREEYSQRDLGVEQLNLLLPEGDYPVKVTLFESSWKRPRWPWPVEMRRGATVEPATPILIPGKGENDFDVDDDAIFSHTCRAQTAAEAVVSLRRLVLKTRERHGGQDWRPDAIP